MTRWMTKSKWWTQWNQSRSLVKLTWFTRRTLPRPVLLQFKVTRARVQWDRECVMTPSALTKHSSISHQTSASSISVTTHQRTGTKTATLARLLARLIRCRRVKTINGSLETPGALLQPRHATTPLAFRSRPHCSSLRCWNSPPPFFNRCKSIESQLCAVALPPAHHPISWSSTSRLHTSIVCCRWKQHVARWTSAISKEWGKLRCESAALSFICLILSHARATSLGERSNWLSSRARRS